ncbi:MAG TPA: site-specific integrase [Candidatus Tectomicrobia bacterium]
MLEHTFVRPSVIARLRQSPLGPYMDAFAASLHQEGYAPSNIQRFLCAAEKYTHWVHAQGYTLSEIDGDLVHQYSAGFPKYRNGNLPKAAQGLGALLRFLHHHGVTHPRQEACALPPLEQWLHDYDAHLEHVAGLALRTRQGYGSLVRRFLTTWCGTELPDWSTLTAAPITMFVRQEAATRRNTGRKQPAVAVRSFLRFLVFRGAIRPGLEAAALSPPQWKYASLPARLTPTEVERVLTVSHDGSAISLRNRAILLCLARLGLRAQDVVLLRFDDVDWAEGRLTLQPGKSRRARTLPLPHDVGEALVAYLRGGRPPSASRHVFLRSRPPFQALTSAAVWAIVRQAFTRAGLVVPPGIASHIFRHTAASQMVNQGVSFKEVADVLGHQSIQTTGIYAKLELETLAAVALPWGGGTL